MVSIVEWGATNPALQFLGLSTDAKPADAPTNSIFFELNTGDLYFFDGSKWAKVGG